MQQEASLRSLKLEPDEPLHDQVERTLGKKNIKQVILSAGTVKKLHRNPSYQSAFLSSRNLTLPIPNQHHLSGGRCQPTLLLLNKR